MKYTEEINKIIQTQRDKIMGKVVGFSTGHTMIDNTAGRLKEGEIMVVGGYTGTGKSYYLLHLVDNLIKENKNKLAVFSTELKAENYILRHACMSMGIWTLDVQKHPQMHFDGLWEHLNSFSAKIAPQLDIFGAVSSYEEIERQVKGNNYDIVMIDYIQDLSIRKYYEEKDAMPLLARELDKLALETNTAIIVASQLNNEAGRQFKQESQRLAPLSFGKQLSQKATTILTLNREKISGKLSDVLEIHITKARNGMLGVTGMYIDKGYQLRAMNTNDLDKYLNSK